MESSTLCNCRSSTLFPRSRISSRYFHFIFTAFHPLPPPTPTAFDRRPPQDGCGAVVPAEPAARAFFAAEGPSTLPEARGLLPGTSRPPPWSTMSVYRPGSLGVGGWEGWTNPSCPQRAHGREPQTSERGVVDVGLDRSIPPQPLHTTSAHREPAETKTVEQGRCFATHRQSK